LAEQLTQRIEHLS